MEREEEGMRAGAVGVELWKLAKRWRCRADAELKPLGLTFVHWWILDGTRRLVQDSGDAVSQAAVALHLELDRMTLSHAMRTLSRRGYVDRGADFVGVAYRIWLTSRGIRACRQGGTLVEAASVAALGRHYEGLGVSLELV